MKTSLFVRILLLSGITTFGTVATASDQLAGALLGAGTGALIGSAIDQREGAIVGGFLGAMIGAVVADDDDHRTVNVRHHPAPVYVSPGYRPAPVVVHPAPRVRYYTQPVFVDVPPPSHFRNHDRYERRDGRWDRDQDYRRDDRGDRNDRGDRDDRGGRGRW